MAQLGQGRVVPGDGLPQGLEQGVDDRVAGADHGVGVDVLALQVGGAGRRRGQVERGQLRRQPPVDLLGIRRVHIARAEARLHVRHRDLVIEGGQRPDEGGRGVTLHHHQIGLLLGDQPVQAAQGPLRHTGEGLTVPADVEIVVRNQAEQVEHLVEHAAMLAGDHDPGFEVRGVLQGQDERSHLDGFRPGPEDGHDLAGPVGRAGGVGQGVHLTYASCTTSTVRVVLAQSSRCLSVRHTARHPAGTHM